MGFEFRSVPVSTGQTRSPRRASLSHIAAGANITVYGINLLPGGYNPGDSVRCIFIEESGCITATTDEPVQIETLRVLASRGTAVRRIQTTSARVLNASLVQCSAPPWSSAANVTVG